MYEVVHYYYGKRDDYVRIFDKIQTEVWFRFFMFLTIFLIKMSLAFLNIFDTFFPEKITIISRDFFAIFLKSVFQFECCGVKSYKDWLHSNWGRNGRLRAEIGIGAGTVGKVPTSCCNQDGLRDYPTNCGISFDKLELWTYEPFLHTKVIFLFDFLYDEFFLQGCSDALYETAYNNLELAIIVSVIIGTIQVCILLQP